MTVTIYEAKQIDLNEPKAYLIGASTNWAILIEPGSNRPKMTSENDPFSDTDLEVITKHLVNAKPISDARFYELVATNYRYRLNQMHAKAVEWQLEMHELNAAIDRADWVDRFSDDPMIDDTENPES